MSSNNIQSHFDIVNISDDDLFNKAKERVRLFSMLNDIYDDDTIHNIIKHKYDFDNLLLFYLVSDYDDNYTFLNRLNKYLGYLSPEDCMKIYTEKLRQYRTGALESFTTELEFAYEYKKRGYEILFEPTLPNNKKGEFFICKNEEKIFFEVKHRYSKYAKERDDVLNELQLRLDGMEQPFVLSIDLNKDIKKEECIRFSKYIKYELNKEETISKDLPFTFYYIKNNDRIAEITVLRKLRDGEQGYISYFGWSVGIRMDWNALREKIKSGINQLHPDYPGVIILKGYPSSFTEYGLQNALFGDLAATFNKKIPAVRVGNRIFHHNKNLRLSAMIYINRRYTSEDGLRERVVYHNPFASHKLDPEIFQGKNVIQYGIGR